MEMWIKNSEFFDDEWSKQVEPWDWWEGIEGENGCKGTLKATHGHNVCNFNKGLAFHKGILGRGPGHTDTTFVISSKWTSHKETVSKLL